MATKLITPVAILSYPWLAEPQAPQDEGGKAMYSAALIFDPAVMARYPQFGPSLRPLQEAAKEAMTDYFGDKLPGLLKSSAFKTGFRDDWEEKGYPSGSIYINARNERQPGAVYLFPNRLGKTDANGRLLPEQIAPADVEEALYPGAYVRASVRAFGFDKKGNKGVGWALNNLQLVNGSTPRLDSRRAAEDDFDADASAVPMSLDDVTQQ